MKNFKRIYVEITNVCNLNCGFCPKTARKPGFMPAGLFKKILTEVKGHSKYICFHVMGEPLLHPELGAFLDLCREHGCKANITTNGLLIKKVSDAIASKPALRLMNFSLHSFDSNTLDRTVDDYLNDIFGFIAQASSNPEFMTCFRLWNVNKDRTAGKNQYILKRIGEHFRVPHPIEELPTMGNGVKLAEKIYVNQASTFDWPDNKIPDLSEEGFCLGLRTQAAILVDGTVVPCCLDSEGSIALGNINRSTFSEIVQSKRAVDLYEGFSERKAVEPLCRKCGYRKRFNHSRV